MIHYLITKGIAQDSIIPVSEDNHDSQIKLIQKTHELLPNAYKDAFISSQVLSVNDKTKKAHEIIHQSATAAAGVGAAPIPGSDAPIITTIQLTMIGRLTVLYGFDKTKIVKSLGTGLATLAGKQLATSLLKFIPGLGNVINAGVAAAITEALGWYVQQYLKKAALASAKGESIEEFSFDWSQYENLFKEVFKRVNK